MAKSESTTLSALPREPGGSRDARRLRREGKVPGVLYGGEGETLSFAVDGRELRRAVTIRVGGKKIGEGELVEIDGSIGVAVLAINSPLR